MFQLLYNKLNALFIINFQNYNFLEFLGKKSLLYIDMENSTGFSDVKNLDESVVTVKNEQSMDHHRFSALNMQGILI